MDAIKIKTHIMEIIRRRGPSLPIQIAKEVNLSSLFVSAFLSELAGEKMIKISSLKVGGSPVYYIAGQEAMLENFQKFLNPKENEAFTLLKNKKLLKESEQDPAIRVALRAIKDFAVGFKRDEEVYWAYILATDEEVNAILSSRRHRLREEEIKEEQKKEIQEIKTPEKPVVKEIESVKIIEKFEPLETKEEKPKKPTAINFLEEVKTAIAQKNMELIGLESYDKKEVIAKIRYNLAPENIHLLFAYNKKKINDKDLLKVHKASVKYSLDYVVLFRGEISKKLKDTIEAYKHLFSTEKIE